METNYPSTPKGQKPDPKAIHNALHNLLDRLAARVAEELRDDAAAKENKETTHKSE